MKTKVYTREEFFGRVYGEGGSPIIDDLDKRFVYFDYQGDFPWHVESNKYRVYFITFETDTGYILGLGKLQENPIIVGEFWINYVCVDKRFQGEGISRKISETMFSTIHDLEDDIYLKTSNYTVPGKERLEHVFLEYAKKFDIKFINGELRYHETV